jgi:signal transduction histidine kinase
MEFNKEQIVLNNIIEEIIEVVSGAAKQKQIKIIDLIEKDLEVSADINMLRSILQNLISNALKFTKPGGEISIHSEVIDNHVQITVSDTGIGLEKRQADSIFQTDSLHTTAGTNGEKGTGLGLSLVKEMVQRHNGQIWVDSTLGNGSDFNFTIPMKHMV